MILQIGGIGPMELGLILAIVILLFGASRLPKLANSLGRSTKEFKRGREELREELEEGEAEE